VRLIIKAYQEHAGNELRPDDNVDAKETKS